MPKNSLNVSLKGADDIFSTEESRQEQQREQVQQIPIGELFPFKNHPFKVLDDESMQRTVESVEQYGVLSPLIARPRPEGGYEIISGHRRQHAAQLAGLDALPVIVRQMDDDAAVLLMVDADMMLLGTYRGFELNIRFDSFKNEHQAVLRAELSYPVSLGDDARGNITRLDNAIDNFADRIADAENALQNLEQQKQAAEVEVAKPFAQEEELAEKSARLSELNALLNIDRSSAQDSPEKTEETPTTRPSVLAALEEKVNQPEPVKPFKSYLDKEGR